MVARIKTYAVVASFALVTNASAFAQERMLPPPQTLPPAAPVTESPPCGMAGETVMRKQVLLVPEESATTLPRINLREVDLCREKRTRLEIDWKEEKRTCTEMVLKEKTVEQEVTCMTVKPEKVVDPATGQACTVYKQVPEVQKIAIKTYEVVPEVREYLVRYPCLKPVENEVLIKKLEIDRITIPAVEHRLRAVVTPCVIPIPARACPSAHCATDQINK